MGGRFVATISTFRIGDDFVASFVAVGAACIGVGARSTRFFVIWFIAGVFIRGGFDALTVTARLSRRTCDVVARIMGARAVFTNSSFGASHAVAFFLDAGAIFAVVASGASDITTFIAFLRIGAAFAIDAFFVGSTFGSGTGFDALTVAAEFIRGALLCGTGVGFTFSFHTATS